ncbi:MAG: hypothetical protein GQ527_09790, partial [Bacteroidales bacterium]|nr:hypothetical protein [Bacteroidales bacterium]
MYKLSKYLIILLSIMLLYNIGHAQDLNFYWANQYGSDNIPNDLKSLCSDNTNQVLAFTDFEAEFTIGADTYTSVGGTDLIFYAVNESGMLEWTVKDGGVDNEYAQQIKCDADGNVYIIGKFSNSLMMNGISYESNGTFDMFLAKYSNSGAFEWCKVFGGPNSESLVSL